MTAGAPPRARLAARLAARLPALLAALLAATAPAGCGAAPAFGPRATELPPGGARLPARLQRGLWLVRAELPAVPGEHLLLLDTGTDRLLLDLPLAHRTGLVAVEPDAVRTATGASVPSLRLGRLPWLRSGDVTFRDVDVAGVDLHALRETGGLPIAGIAGCDLFRQCLLELDYRRRTARVLPRSAAPREGGLPCADRLPRVHAEAGGLDLEVLIDTGFQHALAVPPATALPWLSLPRRDGELATLDGVTAKSTARLDGDLRLGALTWRDPRVVLAPGPAKFGTALLRGCRLLLDPTGQRVWIER